MLEIDEKVRSLPPRILVLGAGGFVGNYLFRLLARHREDVYGTLSPKGTWRSDRLPTERLFHRDLTATDSLERLFEEIRPGIVLNCVTHGAYPSQRDVESIVASNLGIAGRALEWIFRYSPRTIFLHAGSSSEYGDNAASPVETEIPRPNSVYAVAKLAASEMVNFYGRKRGARAATLRFYSIYGPYEEESRFIPTLLREAMQGRLPALASADISRDFLFVEDACEAFLDAAHRAELVGETYNIGTGRAITLGNLALWAKRRFSITELPKFGNYPEREWEAAGWRSNPERAWLRLGWEARHSVDQGLEKTISWREAAAPRPAQLDRLAVIVACYDDGEALREMHERLSKALATLPISAKFLFVNDGSHDDTESALVELSREDARITGISHSRNFGSQAAFRSGMELCRGMPCVLMDGDLQDPPELIPELYRKWKEGNEIVYGVRASREEPRLRQVLRKTFYRLFRWNSEAPVPLDAGDFGLLGPRAVEALLQCPESDPFWRGLRSYIGFSQAGVPYHRPARKYGSSTNSWLLNLEWAKKGIFFSGGKLLSWYFVAGLSLAVLISLLGAPRLWTLFVVFQTAGMAIATDYLGRILKEVKGRPLFIRHRIISQGLSRDWVEQS